MDMERRETAEERGGVEGGKSNQDILYEKNIFNKRKKKKRQLYI